MLKNHVSDTAQNKSDRPVYKAVCPSRVLLDQVMEKWSVLVILLLSEETLRFNEIKRSLDGVTQKALTQSLRRLERNGMVVRRVIPTSQVAVEYSLTSLGRTVLVPFEALHAWTVENSPAVFKAQSVFDEVRSGCQ